MRDPDLLAQGNDAPAGSADAPTEARVAAAADRRDRSVSEGGGLYGPRVQKLTRILTAGAAGTTSPLHRSNYAGPTSRGYSEAMGRGFELALTLVVMGAIGWGIDHLAGTYPLFIIIFSVLGFAGVTVKLFIGYDLEMREHSAGAIWNRGSGTDHADLVGNGRREASERTIEP